MLAAPGAAVHSRHQSSSLSNDRPCASNYKGNHLRDRPLPIAIFRRWSAVDQALPEEVRGSFGVIGGPPPALWFSSLAPWTSVKP